MAKKGLAGKRAKKTNPTTELDPAAAAELNTDNTPVPRAAASSPPARPGRPSSLLDTRVVYCGDNLEQLSQDAENVKLMNDVLQKAFVCKLCGARIDKKSLHLDHIIEKSAGGTASLENSQWLHPYCDSTATTAIGHSARPQVAGGAMTEGD